MTAKKTYPCIEKFVRKFEQSDYPFGLSSLHEKMINDTELETIFVIVNEEDYDVRCPIVTSTKGFIRFVDPVLQSKYGEVNERSN